MLSMKVIIHHVHFPKVQSESAIHFECQERQQSESARHFKVEQQKHYELWINDMLKRQSSEIVKIEFRSMSIA